MNKTNFTSLQKQIKVIVDKRLGVSSKQPIKLHVEIKFNKCWSVFAVRCKIKHQTMQHGWKLRRVRSLRMRYDAMGDGRREEDIYAYNTTQDGNKLKHEMNNKRTKRRQRRRRWWWSWMMVKKERKSKKAKQKKSKTERKKEERKQANNNHCPAHRIRILL